MEQVLGDYGVAVVLIAVQRGLFKLCCRKISVLAITLMRIDWTWFGFFLVLFFTYTNISFANHNPTPLNGREQK